MDKQFRMFTVGKLFTVTRAKGIPAKKDLIEGNIPYVTRTTSNNGYMGTCGNADKINPGNCITIGGETGVAFYQPAAFVAGNNMCRLSIDGLTEHHYLYLASVLNKLTKNYSYSNARTLERIKKEQIPLPVTSTEQPDWDYMQERIAELEQERIAELEQERIAELEQYLIAAGLNDYTLTDEDLEVLRLFRGEAA